MYSPKSCDEEKLSIPLEPQHKAQSSEIFLSFPQKIKGAVVFLSFGQSCWNCILKRPRSRAYKCCMACRIPAKKSCSSHLFWGGPKQGCFRVRIIESHNFFVLGPILVKFHIRTRLIKSFPSMFRFWCCAEEKLHFTPFHTLANWSMTRRCFHHFRGSQSFERGMVRKLHAGLWGGPNLKSVGLTVEEK